MLFGQPKGMKGKHGFVEEVLYKVTDFRECAVKHFIEDKVQSRCNFLICGDSND
jgi:hypothetical protein